MSSKIYESKANAYSAGKQNDEALQKICFLINNLTDQNLTTQFKEIQAILSEPMIIWLAEFIVRRSGTESNLHYIYKLLIENLKSNYDNIDGVIIETLKLHCDSLLKLGDCGNILTMKTLKNYGSFLGYLTLARDIHVCLDLKNLLRDTYHTDKSALNYVLPFVCKILRGLEYSKKITKYHAWSQEILAILKELYDLSDKANLQFEIEILFKNLDLSIMNIQPAFFIRLSNLRI